MTINNLTRQLMKICALLFVLAGPGLSWAASEAGDLSSININTASAEQISAALNGVGLKRAQAIVQWREKNGNFSDVSQLTEIKGIGEKILAKNSGRIALE